MQISLKWINELVNIQEIDLDELITKLTLGGFEVEDVVEIKINNEKQIALEISATANRSDSLSVQGISFEIAALLDKEVKIFKYQTQILDWKKTIKNVLQFEDLEPGCSSFIAFTIENLNTIVVPNWVKEKLISSGITPSNGITDLQNYVLLETGYPFAIYDLEKIYSKFKKRNFKLSVSTSRDKEIFIANKIQYELNNSLLVIKANNETIGIGGITESDDFVYSTETTSLLLEASIFTASKIRQQSRLLNLRTDRSTRYEKSLKNTYLIEAVYRFIYLLRISNPNIICKLHTNIQNPEPKIEPIKLYYRSINEILGPTYESSDTVLKYLEPETISKYLSRLQFNFSFNALEKSWEVNIPPYRMEDLTREIDIIEEIGRLHGFNNFLTNLPSIKNVGKEDQSYKIRKKVSECLLKSGFTEFIHYSLVNDKKFLKNELLLVNPLVSDCEALRLSLLPNLIITIADNLKQGNDIIEGFEYGHIFLKDSKNYFKEQEYLAGIFGGFRTKSEWSTTSRSLSWFEAKGKIEQLLEQLELKVNWKFSSLERYNEILHPYRKADLIIQKNFILGTFGQIHPIIANEYELPKDIYLFEFNFELIKSNISNIRLALYKEYSVFPKIKKDISFIVPETVQFEELKNMLLVNGTKYLSTIQLLDEYRGDKIPKNYVSLCIELTFYSEERTLENKEIEVILEKLEKMLNNRFKAVMRI